MTDGLGLPQWFWAYRLLACPVPRGALLHDDVDELYDMDALPREAGQGTKQMDLLAEQNRILSRIATALEGDKDAQS